jgi:RNA recognition motif-containing protein
MAAVAMVTPPVTITYMPRFLSHAKISLPYIDDHTSGVPDLGLNETTDFRHIDSDSSAEVVPDVDLSLRADLTQRHKHGAAAEMSKEYADCVSKCILSGMTTLMMRHIPCTFSKAQLENIIEEGGFAGLYDWLYVPSSKHRHCKRSNANLGYAFINFVKPADAEAFLFSMNGSAFMGSNSQKTLSISIAERQRHFGA